MTEMQISLRAEVVSDHNEAVKTVLQLYQNDALNVAQDHPPTMLRSLQRVCMFLMLAISCWPCH
jgi:hypothetical protein